MTASHEIRHDAVYHKMICRANVARYFDIYTHIYIYIYTNLYLSIYVSIYLFICLKKKYIYIYTHICIVIHTSVYVYVSVYMCIHVFGYLHSRSRGLGDFESCRHQLSRTSDSSASILHGLLSSRELDDKGTHIHTYTYTYIYIYVCVSNILHRIHIEYGILRCTA